MEHPDISFIRSNGYAPSQLRSAELRCPVCDAELSWDDDTYVNKYSEIVGCCHCAARMDAAEVLYNE